MRPKRQTKGSVGVVTLPGNFNYGNKLQLYAVMRAWEKLGYSPTFLACDLTTERLPTLKRAARRMLGMELLSPAEEQNTSARAEAFRRFGERIPERRINHISKSLRNEYDAFSVGSDQVWNSRFFVAPVAGPLALRVYRALRRPFAERRFLNWYFLGFCCSGQRVAVAPSIGSDSLSTCEAKLLARGVSNFHRLSVRELRAAKIIRECSGRRAEVLCDPTLTLTPDGWRALADSRCTPGEPYVFTYLLGGAGDEVTAVLDEVTNHGDIPVVPLTDRQQPGEPDAGPAEFIDLIDHATHVVTDSFHASVFSMLLRTPLTITHRQGSAPAMFSRLESLADTFGLWKNVCGSPEFDLSRAGEYSMVAEPLERERKKFMDYLRECLGDASLAGLDAT